MDIVKSIDTAIEFTKKQISRAVKFWNDLDEDKKKLCLGCAAAACLVIVAVGIAYGLGTAHGKKVALEEDDF